MPTVVMPTSKQVVCAVQVVQDAKHPKTLVKPIVINFTKQVQLILAKEHNINLWL